ncbi:hypothetical protein [Mesorhizobium sp.]|uniref:hypothetical protein n=1 Tax=Mesorhizobium sp. TaxID=1871066 RepID=UPI0012027D90|nr:hypothetical protein [Mesorhizobium sp.]TIL34312.1 MAG: hypothetical protein E5Y85_11265 [Mesorhizobium sp.]
MASRFWVGGTGTWDASDTTHWAATSGGAGGASVPGSGDAVTFNGLSGGGTVTVSTTVTVQSITCGAFTGTLDFSVNNNNVTTGVFDGSGSGARTIKLGNGTWTITNGGSSGFTLWNMATVTNLTFDAGQSTLDFTGVGGDDGVRIFAGGGLAYSSVRFRAQANGAGKSITGANTFGNLTVDGLNVLQLAANQTVTTLAINGAPSAPVLVRSNSDSVSRTISVASNAPIMTSCALRDITGAGGASFIANDSFDFGNNSGITINPPGGGGGGAAQLVDSGALVG